jgi:hypothetical protein
MTRQPSDGPGFGSRFVLTGFVVAALDISFACAYWVGVRHLSSVPKVFQSVAVGLIGKSAMDGGTATVLLGAALHTLIAFIWTALLVMALRLAPALHAFWLRPAGVAATGLLYGVVIWLLMNHVVLAVSHGHPTLTSSPVYPIMLVWHAIGVGLPMALLLRGSFSAPRSSL